MESWCLTQCLARHSLLSELPSQCYSWSPSRRTEAGLHCSPSGASGEEPGWRPSKWEASSPVRHFAKSWRGLSRKTPEQRVGKAWQGSLPLSCPLPFLNHQLPQGLSHPPSQESTAVRNLSRKSPRNVNSRPKCGVLPLVSLPCMLAHAHGRCPGCVSLVSHSCMELVSIFSPLGLPINPERRHILHWAKYSRKGIHPSIQCPPLHPLATSTTVRPGC